MTTPCILWTGALNSDGYGVRRWRGGLVLVHRLAWMRAHKRRVPAGLEIAHECFIRNCHNPAHLRACTHRENAAMSVAAGRYRNLGAHR